MRISIQFAIIGWCFQAVGQGTFLKTYDFGGSSNHLYGIVETPDSGFAVAGTHVVNLGDIRLLTAATDRHGNEKWHTILSRSWNQEGSAVELTDDGGSLVAGKISINGTRYFWLVRFDQDGDTLWSRIYGDSVGQGCTDMVRTPDGNYVLVGVKWNPFAGNPRRAYVIKVNDDGDTLWTYLSPAVPRDVVLLRVATDDSGNIYSCGWSDNYGPDTPQVNMVLLKLSRQGKRVWINGYGDMPTGNTANDLEVLPSQDVVLAGNSSIYITVALIDTAGDLLQYAHVGNVENSDDASTIVHQANVLVVGGGTYEASLNDRIPMLMGLTFDLDSQWVAYYSIAGGLHDAAATFDSGFVFTGYTDDGLSLLIKTDSNGCVTPGCHYSGIPEPVGPEELSVYPNPTSGTLTVTLPLRVSHSLAIRITNSVGQVAMARAVDSSWPHYDLDLRDLASGFYVISLTDGVTTWRAKVIKQ